MKLYATATSERASKAQGGNEFIDAIITIGGENPNGGEVVAVIQVSKRGNGYMLQSTITGERVQERMLDEKGKKQKGENNISAPSRPDWIDDGADDTY